MSALGTVLFTISDVMILVGWVWSLARGWNAARDPDFELAIESARTSRSRSVDDLGRDAVEWKHRLENRASYPAFGSAVLSGVAVGFSGNAVGASASLTDAWIVSAVFLVASLAVAFTSRLIVAKRIQRYLATATDHQCP